MNLREAIVESCDVYFYKLSLKLGVDRLYPYLKRFGLGERTGIVLPEETGSEPFQDMEKKTPERTLGMRVKPQCWQ